MVVLINFHGLRRKKITKKHIQHNHGQKVRIALLMNCVNAAMLLESADPTMDEVLHRGRQSSSRLGLFWGNFFFSFWRKSLIGCVNTKYFRFGQHQRLCFRALSTFYHRTLILGKNIFGSVYWPDCPIWNVLGWVPCVQVTPHLKCMRLVTLSLIHIWRCRRIERCRSRWSPYH